MPAKKQYRKPSYLRASTATKENRICPICNSSFESFAKMNQKYCSLHCGNMATHKKYRKANPLSIEEQNGIKLSCGTKGTLSELKVAVDLIEKGYEVFRAVSPASPCDYAIMKNGKLLKLEVKSRYYSSAGNVFKLPPHKADILALVYPDNKIKYFPLLEGLI